MREARVATSVFDLRGFIDATVGFLVEASGLRLSDADAGAAIAPVGADSAMDLVCPDDRDIAAELLSGTPLFFPFSTTHAHAQPILCADGGYYWLLEPWEGEEEADFDLTIGLPGDSWDSEESPDIELEAVGYSERLPMAESDYLGFLVAVDGDSLVIASAMAVARGGSLPLPVVSRVDDCHIFEQPMAAFLMQFMARDSGKVIPTSLHPEDCAGPLGRVLTSRASMARDLWLN
jgi:hypothetical protein